MRQFEPRVKELRGNGIGVLNFGIGQPDYGPPPVLLKYNAEYAGDRRYTGYGESIGEVELRRALAKRLSEKHELEGLNENNLSITFGSSEAILQSLVGALDPKDGLVLFEPAYFNYEIMATALGKGKNVIGVRSSMDDNFHIPESEKMISEITQKLEDKPHIKKVKAIIVNTANNPTGAVYNYEDWKRIHELAMYFGAGVISDEAYTELVYDGKKHVSAFDVFEEDNPNFAVLGSFSKDYGWPGSRIGYIVTFDKLFKQAVERMERARGSHNPAVLMAASHILEIPESYFDDNRREYQARRDLLYERLEKIPGVKLGHKPEGAFYLIAELPVDSAINFCWFLLNEYVDDIGATETWFN